MANTYQQDPATLPPLTKAIAETYGPSASRYGHQPSISPREAALLDAIHALETRVIALETP